MKIKHSRFLSADTCEVPKTRKIFFYLDVQRILLSRPLLRSKNGLKIILPLCIILVTIYLPNQPKCEEEIIVHVSVMPQEDILPYFLSQFEAQEFPKHCMHLKFFTPKMYPALMTWIDEVDAEYHSVSLQVTSTTSAPPAIVTNADLELLATSQTMDAFSFDSVFFIDSNVVIVNPTALRRMLETQYPLIALVLNSTEESKVQHFNQPSIQCREEGVINQEFVCSPHASLNSFFLVRYHIFNELRIQFSSSTVHSCGCGGWGYVLPLNSKNDTEREQRLTDLRLAALNDDAIIQVKPSLRKFTPLPPKKTFMGLDHVFYMNMDRRKDRRLVMEEFSDVLGLQMERVPGVDGNSLTPEYMRRLGATEYSSQFFSIQMQKGYIGSLLTHFFIWASIVANNYEKTLVLEDDVRIPPGAIEKFKTVLKELESTGKPWDFVYLYRRDWNPITQEFVVRKNPRVRNTTMLVYPGYALVLMAYMVSLSGAKTFLQAKPMVNIQNSDYFVADVINKDSYWSIYQVQSHMRKDFVAYAVEPNLFLQREMREDGHLKSDTLHTDFISW